MSTPTHRSRARPDARNAGLPTWSGIAIVIAALITGLLLSINAQSIGTPYLICFGVAAVVVALFTEARGLFLVVASLPLVFGIMDTLNLAHGALFMAGGYVSASVHTASGSFLLAIAVGILATVALAAVLEAVLIRRLYVRDHLAQVLATFGVILIADDAVKAIWGPSPIMAPTPAALSGPINLFGFLP